MMGGGGMDGKEKKGEPRGGEEGGWVTIYVGLDNTGEVAIGLG